MLKKLFVRMKSEKTVFEISLLIRKALIGEAEPDELRWLEEWKEETVGHAELFDRICSQEQIRKRIEQYRECGTEEALAAFMVEKRRSDRAGRGKAGRMRQMLLGGMSVAAVVVLGVAFFALWQPEAQEENRSTTVQKDEKSQVVRLVAGSGQVFDLDTLRQMDGDLACARNGNGALVFSSKSIVDVAVSYNTVDVPQGAEYELVLTDGTKVFLNAETSFRFPESFPERGEREVFLSGEAFFKVAKDSLRPFVVRTDGVYTKVLGTSFNVMAYKNRPVQQTTLVEGRVRVGSPGLADEMELVPGMQVSYDKSTRYMEKRKVDVSYYIAWKEGVFAFREERLGKVMEELSRWYGFEFTFLNASMKDVVYTGKVGRHGDLNSVLEHFRQTGEMDFDVNGKTIIIKPKK